MKSLKNKINKNLKHLAFCEMQALKIHAKNDELCQLDLKYLDGGDPLLCIYGQMTGSCYSDRAHQLIKLCGQSYSGAVGCKTKPISGLEDPVIRDFTALEFYVACDNANLASVVKFLHGEITEFELEL